MPAKAGIPFFLMIALLMLVNPSSEPYQDNLGRVIVINLFTEKSVKSALTRS
jgi:hypothetical protein